jgi:MarR family transcriptional regulator, organic hydroperoxide resistance regulator
LHADGHARLDLAHADLDGIDELSARVFRAFIAALRLHKRQMASRLSARGMHPGQALCLRVVAGHDGIAQRDLAGALHLAPPTLTRMVQALERSGAVERRPDPEDRRLTRVYLTSRGWELKDEFHRAAADYVTATIGTLSVADREELARLLEKLGDTMERATPPEEDHS